MRASGGLAVANLPAPDLAYNSRAGHATGLATTSLSVTLSGVAADMDLLAIVSTRDAATVTTPSGWALLATYPGDGASASRFRIYTIVAAGGETNVTFACSSTNISASVLAFTGGGVIGNTWETTAFSFSTAIQANGVTVLGGSYRISMWAADQNDVAITPPSGGTVVTNIATTSRDHNTIWIEGPLSAGAAVNKTATYGSAANYKAATLEMRPT